MYYWGKRLIGLKESLKIDKKIVAYPTSPIRYPENGMGEGLESRGKGFTLPFYLAFHS
jgi:hypothetical protein